MSVHTCVLNAYMCVTSKMHLTVAAAAADGIWGLCYQVNRCKINLTVEVKFCHCAAFTEEGIEIKFTGTTSDHLCSATPGCRAF